MGKATVVARVRMRKSRGYAAKLRAGAMMYGPGCCAHNRLGGQQHKAPACAPGIPWAALRGADRDAVVNALLDPPKPTPRLVAALKRHRG
ncbi:MAG: DUF1778 domain-containing protein [Acidobacteriales bacterium]|nr:DUF1778 domain-containing protein [Terriglobales bacterium]